MNKRSFSGQSQEKAITQQRAVVGIVFIACLILVLLARIAYLQIWNHEKYTQLSERNQLRLVPIPPARGLIYDRRGKLLARNVPAFHLVLIPEHVPNLKTTLDQLSEIIPLDEQQRQTFLEKVKHSPKHQRQILKLKLSEEEVSRFAVNQYRFPGANLVVDLIREYPYGPLLAHILGYVSEGSKEELKKVDAKRYAGTYQMGKIGLEKFYEDQLQGQPGYQQMETDVLGREVRAIASIPPVAGNDLYLTLDLNLQVAATQALGESRGAIVVLNPKNGEILALASTPSFDPNQFVRGINQKTYQALRTAPERPLFNRAIQGQYPPASTIKPVVGLAGLATRKMTPEQKVFDPGWYQLNGRGRLYRDWVEKGHGWTDLEKSIRESCDIYYYQLAEKLGISQLSSWLSLFGFGRATGIDLPGELKGIVPSHSWKKKVYGKPWYPGETIITGIGQGYILATPLQLATVASYIANKGEAYRPHLNKGMKPEKLPPLKIDQHQQWDLIINGMRQVIQHPRGTAYRYFAGLTIDIAGKTGTAQVFGLKANEKYKHESVAHHLRDHSLFIAFAPVENPKIAIAVVLENEKASANIARQVIEAYFTGQNYAPKNEIPLSS